MSDRDWRKRLRLAFGVAVWVGLLVAVVANWEEVGPALSGAGPLFPVAVVMIALGLVSGSIGWAVLQPSGLRRSAAAGFLAAQPAKYLPAGVAVQAVGQVGLSSRDRLQRPGLALMFLVHGVVQVIAAVFVSLLLIIRPDLPNWMMPTLLSLAAVGALGLRHRVVAWFGRHVSRVIPWLRGEQRIPSTADLWRSCGLTVIPLTLSGGAFVIMLGPGGGPADALAGMGAFAVAWVVGFLAVPLPSGLGVREVLLISLTPAASASEILGISILHRFATIIAELLLLLVVSRSAFLPKKG